MRTAWRYRRLLWASWGTLLYEIICDCGLDLLTVEDLVQPGEPICDGKGNI
jgi:hypothetical protein